ncbi:hypothetical protein [Sphingomonas sp. 32-62-10]|uniref:hypothetical protein n=1 Tax=Sphingomonas sp. 32-62-10 TaxID=1970436 RepID=UPI000BC8084B|nr:MAG: hypothetical protein B7Y98_02950 [Sphingomonas sp. 32-62-10]
MAMRWGGMMGVLAGFSLLAGCTKAEPKQEPAAAPPAVRIASVGAEQQAATIRGVGTVSLRREASLGFTIGRARCSPRSTPRRSLPI